jgi:ABC-2 type transport system ATP-binding protein
MEIEVTDLTVYDPRRRLGRPGRKFARKAVPALQQLSGVFPTGVNLILGPNGAGKSLLLRILAGLIRLKRGTITLDGQVIDPELLRQNSGYLPQTFDFYPQYNAREMLHYIALLKGISDPVVVETQVEQVLRRTALRGAAQRKIGGYSRGMRRQVGIAQALLGDPSILLLDDPTTGLDLEACNAFRGMMAHLGRERVIVWASSLLADVGCADRVLILDRGECRFWGTPAQLRSAAAASGAADESWSELLERGYRLKIDVRHE